MEDFDGNTLTDPEDIGWWMRVYEMPRPELTSRSFLVDLQRERAMQRGWDLCCQDIDEERAINAHFAAKHAA